MSVQWKLPPNARISPVLRVARYVALGYGIYTGMKYKKIYTEQEYEYQLHQEKMKKEYNRFNNQLKYYQYMDEMNDVAMDLNLKERLYLKDLPTK